MSMRRSIGTRNVVDRRWMLNVGRSMAAIAGGKGAAAFFSAAGRSSATRLWMSRITNLPLTLVVGVTCKAAPC